MDEAPQPDTAPRPARNLTPLRMIWREALKYPWQVLAAGCALVVMPMG